MNYAVTLFFSTETEKKLYEVMKLLVEHGVNDFMTKNHFRPHLTLGIFPSIKEEIVIGLLKEIASRTFSFHLNLSHYIFENNFPAGIGLSPVLNNDLDNVYIDFYKTFTPFVDTFKPTYLKNKWRPLCSIAQKIESTNELLNGLNTITKIQTDFSNVKVTEIGYGSTGPFTVINSIKLN